MSNPYQYLPRNLKTLMTALGMSGLEQLAGHAVSHSTLSRWINKKTKPRRSELIKFATSHGFSEEELLAADFRPVRLQFWKHKAKGGLPLQLECVSKDAFRDKWADLRRRLSQSYLIYHKWRGDPDLIKISLLMVGKITDYGIEAVLFRPSVGQSFANPDWHTYKGILFPVGDFVHGLAERVESGFGIASLMFHDSAGDIRNVSGVISGPGQHGGQARVSTYDFYMVRTRTTVHDGKDAVRHGIIGCVDPNKVPSYVKKFLDNHATRAAS